MPPPLPEKATRNQRMLHNYLLVLEKDMAKREYASIAIWGADQTFYAKVLKVFEEDKAIWPSRPMSVFRTS